MGGFPEEVDDLLQEPIWEAGLGHGEETSQLATARENRDDVSNDYVFCRMIL